MKHNYGPKKSVDKNETRQTCKVCGCVRIHYNYKDGGYVYMRNGIIMGSNAPECVDLEAENNKTID